ncbi:dehydratase [Salinisphaera sp.]|uniref:dehydratase n=1 Tax=Salinisphaera sp. TaxID=1914330 RepID=UPI002D7A196F|nr:dehydratase [Salinisphaera sp.]HET7315022.1 dehydratase [Salinisphaera sp.]
MRYWEDMAAGETHRYGRHELSADEIADFGARFAVPAVAGAEPGAAPGHLLCCIAMRLLVDHALSGMASLGSPGVDHIDWPVPAYAGDVLYLSTEMLSLRPLESRPEMGLVKQRVTLSNQHGEAVARLATNAFVARRGVSA